MPETARTGIVHGDFRLDNALVIGEGDQAHVSAILDWEMATLGDPLVDVGMFAMYWEIAGLPGALASAVPSAVDPAAGTPSLDEMIAEYARQAGIPVPELHWYRAFAAYKLAVVLEGIHLRYQQGGTVDDGFDQMGGLVAQKEQWLRPLLNAEIRSAFCMTEPDVASSDATNIDTRIVRDGDHYVINGRKWWSTGAMNPDAAIFIVMGKTDPEADRHRQQSMIVVPRDTSGVEVVRPLTVFGYDDRDHGGHAEIVFRDARVPASNLIAGEGDGFAIAQALVLKTAWLMDTAGNKQAMTEIQSIKIAVPRGVQQIVDRAIQLYGGAGVSGDTPLAEMYAGIRSLRLADGPDEVHLSSLGRAQVLRRAGS